MRITFSLLFIILILNNNQAKCQANGKVDFAYEEFIKLDSYFKKPAQATQEKKDFHDNFKTDQSLNNNFPILNPVINMAEFKKLYDEAVDHAIIYNSPRYHKRWFITALRVTLGLTLDKKKIKLFYEPIFIELEKKKLHKLKGKIETEGKLYHYNNGGLKEISRQDADKYISLYKHEILIDIFNKDKYKNHETKESWKGDSRKIIFSFQELFKLYELNYYNVDPTFQYDQDLIVGNGSLPIRKGIPTNRSRYKHTLLFSIPPRYFLPNTKILSVLPPEEGDSANLAHMCPPSCHDTNYPAGG